MTDRDPVTPVEDQPHGQSDAGHVNSAQQDADQAQDVAADALAARSGRGAAKSDAPSERPGKPRDGKSD